MPDLSESYPARLDLDGPLEIARWRPLVNWILAIPHFLVLYALWILRGALVIVSFFTVLFTKEIPPAIFDLMVMTYRYEWRTASFALWMREAYPPFDFMPTADDLGGDPATVSIDYPQELNRWLPLVKWLLALPHYVILMLLGIVAAFVALVAFFAVLITGVYPRSMRLFLLGVFRWNLRVRAYTGLLTDRYPPFTLD